MCSKEGACSEGFPYLFMDLNTNVLLNCCICIHKIAVKRETHLKIRKCLNNFILIQRVNRYVSGTSIYTPLQLCTEFVIYLGKMHDETSETRMVSDLKII